MIVLPALASSPLQGGLGARQALGVDAGLLGPPPCGSGLPLSFPSLARSHLSPSAARTGGASLCSGLGGKAQPLGSGASGPREDGA